MKKIILTSAGFENNKIANQFIEFVGKEPEKIKALFITTAAIEPDAIMVLPKCLDDLLNCGILKENITIYDMHKKMETNELQKYDAIYVCGGKTSYLVERMNEIDFKQTLEEYLESGGIYIGVSAGSVAASGTYPDGLNFVSNKLEVHCEKGSSIGKITNNETIYLTNNQAIVIINEEKNIIE